MIEHRSRATVSREAPPADPKDLEAMARRAWRERGIAILWPDKIKDEWDRQHILNIANDLYGKR